MKVPMKLFASFRPADWREEAYTAHPPFVIETSGGRTRLVPRDTKADQTLGTVSSALGLKRVDQTGSYLVTKGSGAKGLREFDWFVRRSWRNSEFSTLWALAYLGEDGAKSKVSITLGDVAEAAGVSRKEAERALETLFHLGKNGRKSLGEITSDRGLIQQTLEKKTAELPIWTEEAVMSALCASPEGSVSELHQAVLNQGLSVGAVYKVSERLKTQGYVYTQRHRRVNERGPMREMLAADCANCFFGYSNQERCLNDSLRQIESLLESHYGKKTGRVERDALGEAVRAVPYASRTNRRVLSSLRMMHEMDGLIKELRIAGVLKRIEEVYGVNLPIAMPESAS